MSFNKILILSVMLLVSCNESLSNEEAVERVSIYIDTGETQCNDDGLSVEETNAILVDAGVSFTEPQCGYITGLAYPAVCGADTSHIYIYTVEASDFTKIENLGFKSLSNLDNGLAYKTVACAL